MGQQANGNKANSKNRFLEEEQHDELTFSTFNNNFIRKCQQKRTVNKMDFD